MIKILVVLAVLVVVTGSTGIVIQFFLNDPLRILALFVGLFLLVPMAKLVFGK